MPQAATEEFIHLLHLGVNRELLGMIASIERARTRMLAMNQLGGISSAAYILGRAKELDPANPDYQKYLQALAFGVNPEALKHQPDPEGLFLYRSELITAEYDAYTEVIATYVNKCRMTGSLLHLEADYEGHRDNIITELRDQSFIGLVDYYREQGKTELEIDYLTGRLRISKLQEREAKLGRKLIEEEFDQFVDELVFEESREYLRLDYSSHIANLIAVIMMETVAKIFQDELPPVVDYYGALPSESVYYPREIIDLKLTDRIRTLKSKIRPGFVGVFMKRIMRARNLTVMHEEITQQEEAFGLVG